MRMALEEAEEEIGEEARKWAGMRGEDKGVMTSATKECRATAPIAARWCEGDGDDRGGRMPARMTARAKGRRTRKRICTGHAHGSADPRPAGSMR